MLPERVLLATGNLDKVEEWRSRTRVPFDWAPLPDVEETEETYEGNAALKALAAARHTNRISLGDDAGIEVDAYQGAPGVQTKRWAMSLGGWEPARQTLVREALGSRASFRCALALAWPDGYVVTALGTSHGVIIAPAGRGHGLEPCFCADGTDLALSIVDDATWERIHYRSLAWRALRERIVSAPPEP